MQIPGISRWKHAYTVFRSPSFSITRCIISSDSTSRVRANSIELSLKSSASATSLFLSLLYYFIFSPLTFRVRHGPSESIHSGEESRKEASNSVFKAQTAGELYRIEFSSALTKNVFDMCVRWVKHFSFFVAYNNIILNNFILFLKEYKVKIVLNCA